MIVLVIGCLRDIERKGIRLYSMINLWVIDFYKEKWWWGLEVVILMKW